MIIIFADKTVYLSRNKQKHWHKCAYSENIHKVSGNWISNLAPCGAWTHDHWNPFSWRWVAVRFYDFISPQSQMTVKYATRNARFRSLSKARFFLVLSRWPSGYPYGYDHCYESRFRECSCRSVALRLKKKMEWTTFNLQLYSFLHPF